MQEYLSKKAERFHWGKSIEEKTLSLLQEEKLIDDQAFLEWYVRQRTAHKPRGARAILHELSRFRINPDLIQAFFAELHLPEEELALRALERRWPRLSTLDRLKRFEKATAFLSRRGFTYATIKNTIAKMEERE